MKPFLWLFLGLLPSPYLLAIAHVHSEALGTEQRRVKRLEAEMAKCRAAEQRLGALRERSEEVKTGLRQLRRILPPTLESSEVEAHLRKTAGRGFEGVETAEVQARDFYLELPWRVDLRTGLEECRQFVARVESQTWLHEVSGFRFDQGTQGDSWCVVVGRTFGAGRPPPR